MSTIKIRNLPLATNEQVKPGNFLACALDTNSGLQKLTRKLTLSQVVSGGLQDGIVPIPIASLPIATTTSLGVVQIGANLNITPGGILSVDTAGIVSALPIATTTSLGVVQIGANLNITPGGILSVNTAGIVGALPIATTTSLGVVQIGANLNITPGGILSADNPTAPYQLPTASTAILGGIKVGANLTIDPDGTLNAPAPSGGGGGTTILKNSNTSAVDTASVSTTLDLTAGSWLVQAHYTYHQSRVGGGSLSIHGNVVHTSNSGPGDTQGTSQDVLFGVMEITSNGPATITINGTPANGYPGTGLIMAIATLIGTTAATPTTPATPPAAGIVHFSSKIISNAANDTDSKAFVVDPWSDITAAGVYEIQSNYAFEQHTQTRDFRNYTFQYTRLDPNRAGDGWTSSAGLGRAVPTVAKQDLKSMAIPAGTTVKFSLDWTHLGATYVHHQYTREDLVFFEITGPALIVDLSPGESLPDASTGTHLSSMGITPAKVYSWYNILQYPENSFATVAPNYMTIFDQGTIAQASTDLGTASQAPQLNSLYYGVGTRWNSILASELFFDNDTQSTLSALFKLPAAFDGAVIDQRTLRNMPYTSTLIIE